MSYFFLHDSLLVFEDPAIDSTSRYLDVGRTLPRRVCSEISVRVCNQFPFKGDFNLPPPKGA